MKIPKGFRFAGIHAGIKPNRKDVALVVSDVPCAAAGTFTINKAKAAPVQDAEQRLPAEGMRAVVVNAGNANALTGPAGLQDVKTVLGAVAKALKVPEETVVSASTGVIGMRLPAHKIVEAAPALVKLLDSDPVPAAEAIMTTDTRVKMTWRSVKLGGKEVTVSAIAKGSGMIAPQLATAIAVITTDCDISAGALATALRGAMDSSFNNLTVDDDMSTNDAVLALANGKAGNPRITDPGEDLTAFANVLRDLCIELAREIASDGEGATKVLDVTVSGAPSVAIARDMAKSIAGSSLVKSAMFGADPNWGRILATVGARAGSQGYPVDPAKATVTLQGVVVYATEPMPMDNRALRKKLRGPEVKVEVQLHAGTETATAWGCDLGYDYVKINADYTSLIVPAPGGGVARDDRLENYSPSFKVSLLVQALSYISRFAGQTCVIKYGGAALVKESLKKTFCEDVNLLRSVGLKPVVIHGGGPEIARTLKKMGRNADSAQVVEMVLTGHINSEIVTLLNHAGGHAVGVSGKDGGLLRATKSSTLFDEKGTPLGDVTHVNKGFLQMLLDQNYVPVISPVGMGDDGRSYNLSGDQVAAKIATALGVSKLIFLTDVPGILDGDELVQQLKSSGLEERLLKGQISGGMTVKARAILEAIDAGVPQVHVLDGRTPHSVIAELFTDSGVGTLVTRG